MDNPTPNWTKVPEDGLKQELGVSQNWARGDKAWFNLNHISRLWIHKSEDNSYKDGKVVRGEVWEVAGACAYGNGPFVLKTYKKPETAYKWLGNVVGGNC